MPFISTAVAVGLGAVAAGGVASAAIKSHAAGKAAQAQTEAAMSAAQLERKSAKESLDFQKQVYSDQQKNSAPWLQTGQQAIGSLGNLAENFQPWDQQFVAPTDVTEQNDPGFQFRIDQANEALQRSAAARGGLLTGGTLKDLGQQTQDYASNEYGNVYNRALQQYQQSYNQFKQNQADQFNRLAAVSGAGQVAAGQLGQQGSQAAQGVANILGNSANAQANLLTQAGNATASGYLNSANAWGGLATNLGQLPLAGYVLSHP